MIVGGNRYRMIAGRLADHRPTLPAASQLDNAPSFEAKVEELNGGRPPVGSSPFLMRRF